VADEGTPGGRGRSRTPSGSGDGPPRARGKARGPGCAGRGDGAAPPPPAVFLLTFGCRAQQADEEALRGALAAAGFPIRDGKRPEGAGVAVVQGCVVTTRAERDARKAIRRLRREHPGILVVAAGCHARFADAEAIRALGADVVLPAGGPADVAAELSRRFGRPAPQAAPGWPAGTTGIRRRRIPLRIQDGCDCACAYCVVPRVRGSSRSVPAAEVLGAVARLAEAGVPEVVLSGVQTGAWGRDLSPASTLPELLERLLALPRRPRIRISSVEPQHLSPRLLEIVTGDRGVCPHLHLPLQSGSTRLLAAMGRADPAPALGLLEKAWARRPDLAVGLDLIAGLPTEAPADHDATLALLERLPFAYLHVFTFTPRPGTAAEKMVPAVPEREAVLRTRALLRSDERLRVAFRASLFAQPSAEVAVEFVGPDGGGRGTTEWFVPGVVVARHCAPGDLVRGALDGLSADGALRVVAAEP
jgi:threonylcarbamoyladenosine tRNA methylthiotransferase MtaB